MIGVVILAALVIVYLAGRGDGRRKKERQIDKALGRRNRGGKS